MDSSPEPLRGYEAHESAMRAAAKRIIPLRRKMAIEDAEYIVRTEFERQGIRLTPNALKQLAINLHMKPISPVFHPIRARRAGWRWSRRKGGGQ